VKGLLKRKKLLSTGLGLFLVSLGSLIDAQPSSAFVLIDTFDADVSQVIDPTIPQFEGDQFVGDNPPVNATAGFDAAVYTNIGFAVGNERDVSVLLTSGGTNTIASTAGSFATPVDTLTWNVANGGNGIFTVVWDGLDNSPTVNTTGLGAVDLTFGSSTAIVASTVNIDNNLTGGSTLSFRLWDSDGTIASQTYTFPSNPTTQDIIFPFNAFAVTTAGGNSILDFNSIGAIQMQGIMLRNPTNSYNISFDVVTTGIPFEFSPAIGVLSLGACFGLAHLKRKSKASGLSKVNSGKSEIV